MKHCSSPLLSGSAYATMTTQIKAILQAIVYVAQNLLSGKAVLLPWVCKVFLEAYSVDNPKVTIETGESRVIFSARWLLQQLITQVR